MLCRRGEDDVVKLLDFGLVKNLEHAQTRDITKQLKILGTPRYMAPERILNPADVDARSDIYALGAVGYFLLTGKPIFEGDNNLEITNQVLHAPAPRASASGVAGIPEALDALIAACLEKDRARRPQTTSGDRGAGSAVEPACVDAAPTRMRGGAPTAKAARRPQLRPRRNRPDGSSPAVFRGRGLARARAPVGAGLPALDGCRRRARAGARPGPRLRSAVGASPVPFTGCGHMRPAMSRPGNERRRGRTHPLGFPACVAADAGRGRLRPQVGARRRGRASCRDSRTTRSRRRSSAPIARAAAS